DGQRQHGAIERIGIADDELQRAASGLRRNGDGNFLDKRSAAIRAQKNFYGEGLAGTDFVFFDPGVFDQSEAALAEPGDAQIDFFHLWQLVRIRVDARKSALDRESNADARSHGSVNGREEI